MLDRLKRMTHAAHYGSRGAIAERIEGPLAKRTPLSRDAWKSLAGGLFLFWSVRRIFRALRAGVRAPSGRGGRR